MKNQRVVQYVYHWYPKNILTTIVNILALLVSYYFNKSFLWGVFHFIFGWVYLIYCLLLGRFTDGKFVEIITSYF
jgi:hypothetical protein